MANNDRALAAFMDYKAEIDSALKTLAALSEDHWGVSPTAVNGGHVARLASLAEALRNATSHAKALGTVAIGNRPL